MEAVPREVLVCQDEHGNEAFTDWLDAQTPQVQAIVMNRIDRLENGNFGDVEPVGEGVHELRINFGPGFRIYFAQDGLAVHVIRAGNKSTQSSDIKAAQAFWNSHD